MTMIPIFLLLLLAFGDSVGSTVQAATSTTIVSSGNNDAVDYSNNNIKTNNTRFYHVLFPNNLWKRTRHNKKDDESLFSIKQPSTIMATTASKDARIEHNLLQNNSMQPFFFGPIVALFSSFNNNKSNGRGIIGGGRKIIPPMPKVVVTNLPLFAIGGIIGIIGTATNKIRTSEPIHRASYFWYKIGPVVIHYKFTKWWFQNINTNATLEKRNQIYNRLHTKYAPISYQTALELKGLYIKLLQICSSRPDFIPHQYMTLFVLTQDSLPQYPIQDIKTIINNSFLSSQKLSYDEVFVDIDEIALGSASIGQVHKATIKRKCITNDNNSNDNDTINENNSDTTDTVDVAVKVMHPGAERKFEYDFQVFRWLCRIALTGWTPILDEAYRQIMSEFDYRNEASSLDIIRTNTCYNPRSPFSSICYIPQPYISLCTKEVLIMELLDGIKLSDSIEDELSTIIGPTKSKQLIEQKQLELVLGKEKYQTIQQQQRQQDTDKDKDDGTDTDGTDSNSILSNCGWRTKLQLLHFYKKTQQTINTLVDVQGYQMLCTGKFQGDPHPGNILQLKKKKRGSPYLGLIDYGQTKTITNKERYGIAKVILALKEEDDYNDNNNNSNKSNSNNEYVEKIATAMKELGFRTQKMDTFLLSKYARLFFDSDEEGKQLYDCPTPQTYFKLLTELDPLVDVPDVAVFVARCGFILRGMGTVLGKQIKTSKRWSVYARQALEELKELDHNE